MAILTGADGQLKYGDKVIGKTRNFSLNIARDEDATSILNTIYSDTDNESLTFVVDKTDTKTFIASGFLTSVGTSVSVGDAQACEIQFQISGAVSGTF